MRTSTARWTAGSVAVASVALMAAGLALAFADRHHVPPSLTTWDFPDIAGDIEDLTIPGLAYLVASRRPRHPIGWLALTAGLVTAASTFCTSYALRAIYAAPGSLPGARAALWFVNSFALVPIGTVVFLFLLFPTGRLRSRRWVPVAWLEAAILAFASSCPSWRRPGITRGRSPCTGAGRPRRCCRSRACSYPSRSCSA
jgi:hypothetical protein